MSWNGFLKRSNRESSRVERVERVEKTQPPGGSSMEQEVRAILDGNSIYYNLNKAKLLFRTYKSQTEGGAAQMLESILPDIMLRARLGWQDAAFSIPKPLVCEIVDALQRRSFDVEVVRDSLTHDSGPGCSWFGNRLHVSPATISYQQVRVSGWQDES